MKKIKQWSMRLVKYIPAAAAVMLFISSNSTGCYWNNQPDPPQNLTRYRKF